MLPDFNRLKVFYYIYSLKSIAAAARQLHISQPAVSQHLKKLEAEINTSLFVRLHKRMVPTSASERLFQVVEPFMVELQDGLKNIRQEPGKIGGLLRIGSPFEFGTVYLPKICFGFRKKYPAVTFNLKLGEPAPLLSLLSGGKLDFAILDLYLTQSELFGKTGLYSIELLIKEKLILVCSKEYYKKVGVEELSFENLITKEFISEEKDATTLKHWFKHHFNKTASSLNVVMTVDNHHNVISCIKLGMGLGVTASHLVWNEVKRGSIVPITTRKKDVINRMSMVQFQDKKPTLAEKTFITFLKKWIQETEVLNRFTKTAKSTLHGKV